MKVPILIQAYPDDLDQLSPARRRDGFCGKISVCNNLAQAGIKFSLTRKHVVQPDDKSFRIDLQKFLGVCRVVNGLRALRLGAVGARPGAFNTVRYSEKILERHGVSVTTVDPSEFLGKADKLDAAHAGVVAKLTDIKGYAPAPGVPEAKLLQMARLGVALDDWMAVNAIDATAIQCWTSVQENFGCNVCTLMSMMSERFMPSACEVDVTGVLTMHALQLTSCSPSALVDWNNNYGGDEDKCVLFHCGNWAKTFLPDIKMATAPILGSILGVENTYGALGHGLPICIGMALAAKMDGAPNRVFTLLGDGELAECSNWEAGLAAAHYNLDNLVAILDHNTLQITGHTHEIMGTEPVADKWRSFGWNVRVVNGHDYAELTKAMTDPAASGQPTFIIANTVKGKGVSFMENVVKWHHGVPNETEFRQAIGELDAAEAKLQQA